MDDIPDFPPGSRIQYTFEHAEWDPETGFKLPVSRRFDPARMYPAGFDLTPIHDTTRQINIIPFPLEEVFVGYFAQLIAIDGGCRGNGTPQAKSAIGVYVAEESRYNTSLCLTDTDVHTNQRAELEACKDALDDLIDLRTPEAEYLGLPLHRVVLKADSEYVVKGMTEWIFKWMQNGWRNAKGKPVANKELFKEIYDMVLMLKGVNVEVLFWLVPREENREADMLVNAAFNWKEDKGY